MFSHSSHIGTPNALTGGRPWRRWFAAVAAMTVAASLVHAVPAAPTSEQLTASFSEVPETHDGSKFTFNLTFSPEPDLSYKTLLNHAFTVVNGSVVKAERRMKKPVRNHRWTIHVKPDLDDEDNPVGAISITLPATTSCNRQASICTSGNLPLSHSTQVDISLDSGTTPVNTTPTTAPTPVQELNEEVQEEQLTAAFSSVPESHDGAKFTFILTFSPEPDVSYASLRDHAFTVVGGTVTKAKRSNRTSTSVWSNSEWQITVVPSLDTNESPSRSVSITLPTTTSCSDLGAVCTSDDLMLSNQNEATVSASADLVDVPGQPQSVTAQPGPDIGKLTVNWTAATVGSDPEEAVRGYRLQYDCAGEMVTIHRGSSSRSYTITGLDRSRNCLINVGAYNNGGYGLVKWAGSSTTYHQPMNPPKAPASITVTDDENSDGTKVSWTAPASGDAPTSYQIAYWDIAEDRFQYISHSSTTDLNAVIAVAPANLRTVAVRGHIADVAYQDEGVWGAWATGWHSTATASKLDAMTQSDSLSLTLTHGSGITIPLDLSDEVMCPSVAGVYVDTGNNRAWMADPCSAWVHAYDINSEDGSLTYKPSESLSPGELYPFSMGPEGRGATPTDLWSDGTTLWVAEREKGMLLPYRLSDGAFLSSQRFSMYPLNPPGGQTHLAPTAIWSDGDTMWMVDDMIAALIFAVNLDNGGQSVRNAEETFVPSAFDSCYIPEYPRGSDMARSATCTDEKGLRNAIDEYYDEPVGTYSDGRWLWVAVKYQQDGASTKLLAFNLLTGERAASRDITLPNDPTPPNAVIEPLGMWSDGDNLWVVADTYSGEEKFFTFSIPSG